MLSPLLDRLTEPGADIISPRLLGEALHLPLADLARLTQLHRNTLAQHPASPKVQERLGEIVRILARATTLTGDPGRAIVWFRHQPLSGFDHKTAEDLVTMGGADAVLRHLGMLEDGVYA
jgi:uncharacterized protein (DUF2384 family)